VWSPMRLRPINVTYGSVKRDISHVPCSYNPKSYDDVPSPKWTRDVRTAK